MKSNIEHPVLKRTVGFGFKNGVEKTNIEEKAVLAVQDCILRKDCAEAVVDKVLLLRKKQQDRPS